MKIEDLIVMIVARSVSNEIYKRNKRNESYTTPIKSVSGVNTSKDATFRNIFSGIGCLLGIFFAYLAIVEEGVSLLPCVALVILITGFFTYVGRFIDSIVYAIKIDKVKNRK